MARRYEDEYDEYDDEYDDDDQLPIYLQTYWWEWVASQATPWKFHWRNLRYRKGWAILPLYLTWFLAQWTLLVAVVAVVVVPVWFVYRFTWANMIWWIPTVFFILYVGSWYVCNYGTPSHYCTPYWTD